MDLLAEQQLKAEILTRPDEDEPRLIYADWLEEQGDYPRSEFIRVQCELHNLPPEDKQTIALSKRERKLLKEHGESWRASVRHHAAKAKLFRGFIEHVQFGVRQFIRSGAAVLQQEPVRTTHLTALSRKSLADFLACDGLDLIRHLIFNPDLSTSDWNQVGSHPALSNLRGLELNGNRLLANDWDALLQDCSFAPSLERLAANSFLRHQFSVQALAAGHRFTNLRELDLSDCHFTDEQSLLNIVRGNHPLLEKLGLDGIHDVHRQDEVFFEALTRLPNLKSLRIGNSSLRVRSRPRIQLVTQETIHAETLEELQLRRCELQPELLHNLFCQWQLPRLKRINLDSVRIDNHTFRRVARESTFQRLTNLSLAENKLKDSELVDAIREGCFDHLKILNLRGQRQKPTVAKAVLERAELDFTRLDMTLNRIPKDLQKQLRKKFGTGVCRFSMS